VRWLAAILALSAAVASGCSYGGGGVASTCGTAPATGYLTISLYENDSQPASHYIFGCADGKASWEVSSAAHSIPHHYPFMPQRACRAILSYTKIGDTKKPDSLVVCPPAINGPHGSVTGELNGEMVNINLNTLDPRKSGACYGRTKNQAVLLDSFIPPGITTATSG